VSDNNAINATDALKIQNYFVFGTPFERQLNSGSPWVFWRSGAMVQNNYDPNAALLSLQVDCAGDISVDMLGQVIGDFNGSYAPAMLSAVSGGSVRLACQEPTFAVPGQEYDLPLRVIHPSSIGAVSLILNYPPELAEVTGVAMKEQDDRLAWSAMEGELRIGWNSLQPIVSGFYEELLNIRVKTTSRFGPGDMIRFVLAANRQNELADGNYRVIPDAWLSTGSLAYFTNSIPEPAGVTPLTLLSRPNPFADHTIIDYHLPDDGFVILRITDILGRPVATLAEAYERSGAHSLRFDAITLQPGVYMASIRLESNREKWTRTIKLIRDR